MTQTATTSRTRRTITPPRLGTTGSASCTSWGLLPNSSLTPQMELSVHQSATPQPPRKSKEEKKYYLYACLPILILYHLTTYIGRYSMYVVQRISAFSSSTQNSNSVFALHLGWFANKYECKVLCMREAPLLTRTRL